MLDFSSAVQVIEVTAAKVVAWVLAASEAGASPHAVRVDVKVVMYTEQVTALSVLIPLAGVASNHEYILHNVWYLHIWGDASNKLEIKWRNWTI